MKNPAVSIVIPAYNEEHSIYDCLDAISKLQTNKTFEVILVNNGSTDGTANIASRFLNSLPLQIIDEPQKGRGAARSTGFAKANGTYIFSTDADAMVPPNWIEEMLKPFHKKNVVAVSSPCSIHDCKPWQNWLFNNWNPLLFRSIPFFIGHGILGGFSFAILRDVYEKSGGFNRKNNSVDDIELSYAVAPLGTIVLTTKTCVAFSSRRFRGRFIPAIWEYCVHWWRIIFRRDYTVELSDIR